MPLRLSLLDTLLARLNLLPLPLLDTPLAPGIAKVLVSACELGLFDALNSGPLPLDALAERLHCNPGGLALILPILIDTGYLRRRGERYENTRVTRRWLTSSSPSNVAPYVIHSPDIVAIWDHVQEVVREPRRVVSMPYEDDASQPEVSAALARHYAGLAALAMALGNEAIIRTPIPNQATRLLDVGGSHAAYSVLYCRRHPRLSATVIDLQPGIEAGRRIVKQAGLEEHIDFRSIDIVRDPFDEELADSYDVALYFHIAHLLPPDLNVALLKKVARTLRPGGLLVYLDQVTDQTRGSRVASLLVEFMALTVTTIGGTCYPFSTVKGWLEEAGVGLVRRHRLVTPGATMITGRK
jgi:SAM-dependent methyltransferase